MLKEIKLQNNRKSFLTFNWNERGTCKIGNAVVLFIESLLGNEFATSLSSSLDDNDVVFLPEEKDFRIDSKNIHRNILSDLDCEELKRFSWLFELIFIALKGVWENSSSAGNILEGSTVLVLEKNIATKNIQDIFHTWLKMREQVVEVVYQWVHLIMIYLHLEFSKEKTNELIVLIISFNLHFVIHENLVQNCPYLNPQDA